VFLLVHGQGECRARPSAAGDQDMHAQASPP
jgi:hypothetical protein